MEGDEAGVKVFEAGGGDTVCGQAPPPFGKRRKNEKVNLYFDAEINHGGKIGDSKKGKNGKSKNTQERDTERTNSVNINVATTEAKEHARTATTIYPNFNDKEDEKSRLYENKEQRIESHYASIETREMLFTKTSSGIGSQHTTDSRRAQEHGIPGGAGQGRTENRRVPEHGESIEMVQDHHCQQMADADSLPEGCGLADLYTRENTERKVRERGEGGVAGEAHDGNDQGAVRQLPGAAVAVPENCVLFRSKSVRHNQTVEDRRSSDQQRIFGTHFSAGKNDTREETLFPLVGSLAEDACIGGSTDETSKEDWRRRVPVLQQHQHLEGRISKNFTRSEENEFDATFGQTGRPDTFSEENECGDASILFSPQEYSDTDALSSRRGPMHVPCEQLQRCFDGIGARRNVRSEAMAHHNILYDPPKYQVPLNSEEAKEAPNWPLHVKNVPTMSLEAMEEIAQRNLNPVELNTFERMKLFLLRPPLKEDVNWGNCSEANISQSDLQAMVQGGLVEEVPTESASGVPAESALQGRVIVYTTAEKFKKRRRLIQWTKFLNEECKLDVEKIVLASVASCRENFKKFQAFACADFKSYFHQFRTVDPFLGFKLNGKYFRLLTIPTGQRHSPYYAHLATVAIAREALRRCGLTEEEAVADCYIDNIRFCAQNMDQIIAILDAFEEVCREVSATTNETCHEEMICGEEHTFLGVTYIAAQNPAVRLAEKTKTKLLYAAQEWQSQNQEFTLRKAASIFGLLRYCCLVLRRSLASQYTSIKFFRRRASAGWDWDDPARTWPTIIAPLTQFMIQILKKPEAPVEPISEELPTLFTDASMTGWGCVLFLSSGAVITCGGSWEAVQLPERPSINVLELLAVEQALIYVGHWVKENFVHLWVDNTTALAGFDAGNSKAYEVNCALIRVLEQMKQQMILFAKVDYVCSAENPADVWSRIVHH